MLEVLQHVLVTLVAAAAAWLIVRRAFAAVRPGTATHDCASCPVAQAKDTTAPPISPPGSLNGTRPLILVRRTRQ